MFRNFNNYTIYTYAYITMLKQIKNKIFVYLRYLSIIDTLAVRIVLARSKMAASKNSLSLSTPEKLTFLVNI